MSEIEATEQATEQPPKAEADGRNPSAEAATYRRRLRETETERDSLAERVRSYEAADVERSVAGKLADPRDLWQSAALDELRGEDGQVDAEKVTAAVDGLLEAKPHYGTRPRGPKPDYSQGARGGPPAPPRIGGIFSRDR